MQTALDALDACWINAPGVADILRAELAKPGQEPLIKEQVFEIIAAHYSPSLGITGDKS